MKKLTLFATLCALLLGACTTNELDNITPEENTSISLPDLTAAFADEEATKTYVENGKYLRWHEDDRITAFFGNTLNRQYKFKGKTGANSGTFSLVPSGELGTGNDLEAIYAVYPYDESAEISDEGVISLSLPAVQSFAEESFGRGANTMIAVTAGLEDTFLGFKNACGYLKLKLYNEEGKALRSLEVKGNNGEKIAGSATATMEFGGVPTLTMGADATTSVTLDCGEEGIALGTTAETATELWIVLPATTFEGGITITATDIEGVTFEKSTTKPVAITRNDIQPMAALEAEFVVPTPETWKIYYTATAKIEKQSWSNTTFGANIVANKWDETTGEGVITFDGEVARILSGAFSNCDMLISITIPMGVTIYDSAFSNCTKLTKMLIPDNSSISGDPFSGCSGIQEVVIGKNVDLPSDGNAFEDCRGVLYINSTIPSEGFDNTSFTTVTFGPDVKEWGSNAFSNCRSLKTIVLEDGTYGLGYTSFWNCDMLERVEIKGKISYIGYNCFYDGQTPYFYLEDVEDWFSVQRGGVYNTSSSYWAIYHNDEFIRDWVVPDAVTEISNSLFLCCTMSSVTIHENVKTIGASAFSSCRSLENVYCKATTPPTAVIPYSYWCAFDNNDADRKIYVPAASVNAYKTANGWSEYADAIVGYDFE